MRVFARGKAADREFEAKSLWDRMIEFQHLSDWDRYESALRKYDIQWRMRMQRENPPWPHATEYTSPLTFSKVEDVHSVLFNFFSSMQWFKMKALSTPLGDATQQMRSDLGDHVTELLRWSMMMESNAPSFLDRYCHALCLYGAAYGRVGWMFDERKTISEMIIPEDLRDAPVSDKELITTAIGPRIRSKLTKKGEYYHASFLDDDGIERDAKFFVTREYPFRPEGEAVVIMEKISVTHSAPTNKVIDPWRMMIPSSSSSIQGAPRYWVQDRLSPEEIESMYYSGLANMLSKEDMEQIYAYGGKQRMEGRKDRGMAHGSGSAQVLNYTVEEARDWSSAGAPRRTEYEERSTYEVVWEYSYDDVDGDGYRESVVRLVGNFPTPMLMARLPVEYINPSGYRPHFDSHFIRIDNRYAGMGIPEIIEGPQREQNAYYRARSDVLEIVSKPTGMYDSMSGLTPDEIQLTPGLLLRVRDPQRAYAPLQFAAQPDLLFQEQLGLDREAERVVGSTDLGLGRTPGSSSAPRTLGGTAIAVRQQQQRTDTYLTRCTYGTDDRPGGLVHWLMMYHDLLARFMSPEKEMAIAGTDEVARIKREDLQGKFQFLVSLDEGINNPQIRATNSVQRYSMLSADPLFQQNMMARWHLVQDVLKNTGMPAGQAILPPPDGGQRPPMSQKNELIVMAAGMPIDVHPQDNDDQHIQELQDAMMDPQWLGIFNAQTMPLIEAHMQGHVAAKQMKQQMALSAGAAPGGAPGLPPGAQNQQLLGAPSSTLAQTGMGRPEQLEVEGGLLPS